MKLGDIARSLLSEYPFEYDEREPQYFFNIPYVGTFGLIPCNIVFWLETFVFLCFQSVLNILVAILVHKFIVQGVLGKHSRVLLGYGVICPLLLCGPFYLFHILELKNVALMLCLAGAVPNLLTLRVLEATHGMLPSFAQENMGMLVLYFSATLQIKFDTKTLRPVPFSVRIFRSKVTSFLSVFLQTSLLYSVLLPYSYTIAPQRPIHNLVDLYYWGNIVNAFLMASLTSLVLDGMYPRLCYYMLCLEPLDFIPARR
jgi:hypothetical protein